MATLNLKSRRFARDAAKRYPDPKELLEGGVATLAWWCSENLLSENINGLIFDLEQIVRERVTDELSGAMDSRCYVDIGGELAKADYAKRFPNANRLKA